MKTLHVKILLAILLFTGMVVGCGDDNSPPPANSQPGTVAPPSPTPMPSPSVSPSPVAQVPTGKWGGMHAEADVTATGATFKFECAKGETPEPMILDSNDEFSVKGTYSLTAGPVVAGDPRQYPATYTGKVEGDQMTLTVSYTDFSGNPQTHTYNLTQGKDPVFNELCMM